MGLPLARAKTRRRVAVVGAAALALTGVAMLRTRGVEAHEVTTAYPLTCSMVGLSPTFTTNHDPEAGATPGLPLTLHVHLATPATGMAMPTTSLSFTLPKPALVQKVNGVTFKAGGNFTGSATVNQATGVASLTFRGSAASNAITLPDFDISAVTSASATPGDKIQWIGPSQVTLMNGTAAVDTCTPAGGSAIAYAPTVVLDPNAACGATTTMAGHDEHGDHDHGGTPTTCAPTTAPPTTRPVTTMPTTRPVTTMPTTRPPTTRPPTTRPPTTMKPGGGIWAIWWQILCKLLRIC
jgi:hypothetical protein